MHFKAFYGPQWYSVAHVLPLISICIPRSAPLTTSLLLSSGKEIKRLKPKRAASFFTRQAPPQDYAAVQVADSLEQGWEPPRGPPKTQPPSTGLRTRGGGPHSQPPSDQNNCCTSNIQGERRTNKELERLFKLDQYFCLFVLFCPCRCFCLLLNGEDVELSYIDWTANSFIVGHDDTTFFLKGILV